MLRMNTFEIELKICTDGRQDNIESDKELSPDIISQISSSDMEKAKETLKKHGDIQDNEFFRGLLLNAISQNDLATIYVLGNGGINCKRGFRLNNNAAPKDIELRPLDIATRKLHQPQAALLLLQLGCFPTPENLQDAIYFLRSEKIKYKFLLINEIRKRVKLKNTWHQRVLDNDIIAMKYISLEDLEMKDSKGLSTLHYACALGRLDIIKAFAKINYIDLMMEKKDDNGNVPLAFAVVNQHLAVVKYLVENRFAHISVKNNRGNTPLYYATNSEMIEYLKSYGAYLCDENNAGETPFMFQSRILGFQDHHYLDTLIQNPDSSRNMFALNQQDYNKISVLAREVSKNSIAGIEYLLSREADVNCKDDNDETPLFKAISIPAAKLLVEHKADIDHENKFGFTSIGNAVSNAPLFNWFIEEGASLAAIHNALKYHTLEKPSVTAVNLLLNTLGPYVKITNEMIKEVIATLEKPDKNLEEIIAICILFILYSQAPQVQYAKSEFRKQSSYDILNLFPFYNVLIKALTEEENNPKQADQHFAEAIAVDNADKKPFVHLILGHIYSKRALKDKNDINTNLLLIASEHFSKANKYCGNSHLLKLACDLSEKISSVEGLNSKDQQLLNSLRASANAETQRIDIEQKLKDLLVNYNKAIQCHPANQSQLKELFLFQSSIFINKLKELIKQPILTQKKRLKLKELGMLQQVQITTITEPLIQLLKKMLNLFEPKVEFSSWKEHYEFAELLHENHDTEQGLELAIYHAEQAVKKAHHEDNKSKSEILKNALTRALRSLKLDPLPSLTHSLFSSNQQRCHIEESKSCSLKNLG